MRHDMVFHLTRKQVTIMQILLKGNEDGSFCDLDQLLERVTYKTSKGSIQFSIRALIKHGMIEKKGLDQRRSARRVVLGGTEKGYKTLRRDPMVVSHDITFADVEAIEQVKEKFLLGEPEYINSDE